MNVPFKTKSGTLRLAAYFALAGLALMMWPLADHRPFAIVIAMSVGQGLGTISLLLFIIVAIVDAFAAPRSRDSIVPDEEQ